MRAFVLALFLSLGQVAPGAAQDRDPAIQGVIQRQIEAFLADDFETAFGFASPNIKRMFGDSVNFGRMVREGYPMVWRPGDVRYLEQEARGGAVHQKVLVTDQAGVPFVLDYQMIPTQEGWQINGVWVLDAPEVGA